MRNKPQPICENLGGMPLRTEGGSGAASPKSGYAESRDLAKLALGAAIELDKLLHDEAADQNVISSFVEALKPGVGTSVSTGASKLYANVPTIDIFGRALDHFNGASHTNLQNLETEVVALLKPFEGCQIPSEKATVEKLKAFCVALHDELLSDKVRARLHDDPVVARQVKNDEYAGIHAPEGAFLS